MQSFSVVLVVLDSATPAPRLESELPRVITGPSCSLSESELGVVVAVVVEILLVSKWPL